MEYRILGPLEVAQGGRLAALGPAKQRTLLAVLLTRANEVVPIDELVDTLWNAQPPTGARNALQVHVSHLRKTLGSGTTGQVGRQVLVTRAPGYMLRVAGEDSLDASDFEHHLEDSRRAAADGSWEVASKILRSALNLWRGAALSDFRYEPFAQTAIARLELLRVSAILDRIETDLALGRQTEILGELDGLVKSYPLQERLRGQLMLALYRSGRQAEALEVYRDTRRFLADELGIDPSPELRGLEKAILTQDPALDLPVSAPVRPPGPRSPSVPTTRYARNGGVALAYQVVGQGPTDLVFVPGFASHLELNWELPAYARLLRRLATFTRLIIVDRRGTGLSDPLSPDETPPHETMVDDLMAVMDAEGSDKPAIFGFQEGGLLGVLMGASHPDRTRALITYGTAASGMRSSDYPWQWSTREWEPYLNDMARNWGTTTYADELLRWACPSALEDEDSRIWWERYCRMSVSPTSAAVLERVYSETDACDTLSAVHVPSLILHSAREQHEDVEGARYLASRIADAELVELPGRDAYPWGEDADAIADEIERFLTDPPRATEPDRVLTTLLIAAVAPPTPGMDAAAHEGLGAERLGRFHERAMQLLGIHRGIERDVDGNGLLATFDGPARAVRCALDLGSSAREIGLEVRTGIHTGEVEIVGDHVRGVAVHIGEGVCTLAHPGAVLCTSTVKELVAGSGISFEHIGIRKLRHVADRWRLFRAVS